MSMCVDCILTKLRLEIQEGIKEHGLSSMQIMGENILRPQLQQGLGQLRQYNQSEPAQLVENFIQVIETDLYPNRNKSNNGGIGPLAIAGVFLVGLVGYLLGRNSKKSRYE